MMAIVALLMLLVPGLISTRILWHGRTVEKPDYKYVITDYLTYSFLIMLLTYGFMFITFAERTVSFSVGVSAVSHILSASFVFKYSVVAFAASVGLPIGIPWLVKLCNANKFLLQADIESTSTKKLAFYFGSCLLLLVLITVITIYASSGGNSSDNTYADTMPAFQTQYHAYHAGETFVPYPEAMYAPAEEDTEAEPELVFAGLIGVPAIRNTAFYDGYFVLSAPPGFHERAFDLAVSIPSMPGAIIYYTIDGTEPEPGYDRFITRGNRIIQVSGSLTQNRRQIAVHDRSGYWRYSILTHHSESWSSVLPSSDRYLLQGTSFRFRGFVDGVPVTETITATYIIASNPAVRFDNRPIIAVTAPYEDFLYIYYHANRNDPETRRRIFNYEYFENDENGYSRIFSLEGSSQLGGWGSRANAQRTINVHLSRGRLDGLVTHPVFADLYYLRRFRLWNGGNSFNWDHMRDPFAQTASAGLSVPFSDNNLAIKFINGEFWGFTTMREHTSNAHFVSSRLGVDSDNVAIIDVNPRGRRQELDFEDGFEVEEGDEYTVRSLFAELANFLANYDVASDYARQRLFDEFFCQLNFMDYIIANTFFNNQDWPHNNTRFFRAIVPDVNSPNSFDDGRWRFIFHDMDMAPSPVAPRYNESRFRALHEINPNAIAPRLNYVFLVVNNPTFAVQLAERAEYVLENHFYKDRLIALHDEFTSRYLPLLSDMYHRFQIHGSVDRATTNFHNNWLQLRRFITNRHYFYRGQIDELLERVG